MTVVEIPGSKSVTARALFLAAAADGSTTLLRPLVSDDTDGFAEGLRALGYGLTRETDRWLIEGRPQGPANDAEVYCRDGATTARFLPVLAAAGHGDFRFDASAQMRRKVSMLFLDIVGSTALAERLDPEPLRQVMDRYFASCGACIAEHGGEVEKFIGDAILAAFGATVAREDDALRAVRAANGALAALAGLTAELSAEYQVELEARAGVCTGNVVVITRPGDDFRVVGDSVNTAARLQTAARPGEVLLCADTAAMVRWQVGIEPVAPLRVKGKARPLPAWRVTAPEPAADLPGPVTPFIGRVDELEALERGFRRARLRRQVCLATVVGVPGIGKSRLLGDGDGLLADDRRQVPRQVEVLGPDPVGR
ncbi:adenylate/guanylate cyclase domain-containing protein, partial [Kitasatospora sp. NPDC001574]